MKILLSTGSLDNRGHMGVIASLVRHLYEKIPGVEMTIILRTPKQDRAILNRWIASSKIPLKSTNHPWCVENNSMLMVAILSSVKYGFLFAYGLLIKLFMKMGIAKKTRFHEYDFIVDIHLSEVRDTDIWNSLAAVFVVMSLLFLKLSGKPIIECEASVGKPFKRSIIRTLSRFAYNKLDLLIVRDEFSANYLKEIGVNKPEIMVVPDTSFTLLPSNSVGTDIPESSAKPIVGIILRESASSGMSGEAQLNFLVGLANFVTQEVNGTAVFIAYSFSGFFDDRKVIEKIVPLVSNRSKVVTITNDLLLPEELKHVISECDMLVSWRFHPSVHAISLGVPVIGLAGYGVVKFEETIGKLAGQTEWLVRTDERSSDKVLEETKQKILLMNGRLKEMKGQLKPIANHIKEQASLLAPLIMEHLSRYAG